jgi:glycerol uptake facilitator protein
MIRKEILGEFIGTFIMVLFGTGAVAASVLFDSHSGLFQIALIWGFAVMIAIYFTRHLCCAHFNPAVTIAMVLAGRMTKRKLPCYLLGQFAGAITAGFVIYLIFSPQIAAFEATHNIVRGSFESVASAKMFGEYYNQPGGMNVSMLQAAGTEMFGTFLLVLTIFCLTESCNVGRPSETFAPVMVGLTVTSVICLIAPITQAGLNPARDFGPRIAALVFGWGEWAFPDTQGGFFWVYMLAPVLGGVAAFIIFTKVIEPLMIKKNTNDCGCGGLKKDKLKESA